jgi:hypothetical protein
MKRVATLLITLALIAGMGGCPAAPVEVELEILSTSGGSVTVPRAGKSIHEAGTVVALVTEAEGGYRFLNWTGDVASIANADAPETTITMNDNYSITANFIAQHDLTVSSTTGGSVIAPGEGTFTYDADTVVDLVAEADAGYRFAEWTGDVETVGDVGAASTTITLTGNREVAASFEGIAQYDLTISGSAGGSVIEPGEGTFVYDEGAVVSLVAQADVGYRFVVWTGDVGTVDDVGRSSTTILMDGPCSVSPQFEELEAAELFAAGNGTKEDPYRLTDWYHLNNIRYFLSAHYRLMNDLDSTVAGYDEWASKMANGGTGWQPIGQSPGHDADTAFMGFFDGQGYAIGDLFISRSDQSQVGLFGVVLGGGVIENVRIVNGSVTGHSYVGGLIGSNEGTVINSCSTGAVTGRYCVGGLVGLNWEGIVRNSYATGTATGPSYIGGLVGYNRASVINSYSSASVSGGNEGIGGLVGLNHRAGTVSSSYSTGSTTGNQGVGGLVGSNQGAVSNSFWDLESSGVAESDGGTDKTTAEMMDITTFSGAGWNIAAVATGERNTSYTWNIVDGQTYPFLSWQPIE